MLKRYLLILTALFFTSHCFAQDTLEVKRKLAGNVTEIFKVLAKDVNIRQGLFRAVYKKDHVVAIGNYENDKKVSLWKFYDPKGTVMQTYDYSTGRLFYEAPEDTTSHLRYLADKFLKEGDKVTKPIKVGGRYYGYLPYLNLFTLPKEYAYINRNALAARVELLVSPGGRLADYKVTVIDGDSGQPFRTINMNIKLPDPADLVFIPATLNGEPIACRIIIQCVVTNAGHLAFE
ncbi:hypothetical protein IDJ75_14325 [Mucilaginibacter rigui]|uniref:TonB C-terminal domain-containing protein n=1 Tax=Mucilaginibacter rigui TaxID=534635 RepID=A0ABR7X783_9SPHI|nr:hypothetical protein [Mucilaginibacter rigui]MBD1386458.1 hypothetical protein [Mucilaginibacter rigui]